MNAGPGYAVVVGATGTLGAAIVRRLRASNVPVVAVARDVDTLAELTSRHDGVVACPADIATADAEEQIHDAVPGPVRMVVQAAGLPAAGPVDTVDPQVLGDGVALKVGGLLRLVRALDDRLGSGSRVIAPRRALRQRAGPVRRPRRDRQRRTGQRRTTARDRVRATRCHRASDRAGPGGFPAAAPASGRSGRAPRATVGDPARAAPCGVTAGQADHSRRGRLGGRNSA